MGPSVTGRVNGVGHPAQADTLFMHEPEDRDCLAGLNDTGCRSARPCCVISLADIPH